MPIINLVYEAPKPIDTPGIYHNSTLGLISLSSDGSNWITIADKNLGATQVRNDGDTLSEANAGKFYQWGNNYGFSFGVSPATISSTQANAGNNGPGNYYSSSTFITVTGNATQDNSWDSSYNENLRGGVTDTNEARRGPCPIGYHVPSKNDVDQLGLLINALGVSNIETYLKIPFTGRLLWTNGSYQTVATSTYSWTSDISKSESLQRNYRGYMLYTYSTGLTTSEALKSAGFSIRPFKNDAVQPDDTRTVLYQPS